MGMCQADPCWSPCLCPRRALSTTPANPYPVTPIQHPHDTHTTPTAIPTTTPPAARYWVIGPRSHIELRSLLEQQLVDALDDAAGEDQEQHAALRGEALAKLPQVFYY